MSSRSALTQREKIDKKKSNFQVDATARVYPRVRYTLSCEKNRRATLVTRRWCTASTRARRKDNLSRVDSLETLCATQV